MKKGNSFLYLFVKSCSFHIISMNVKFFFNLCRKINVFFLIKKHFTAIIMNLLYVLGNYVAQKFNLSNKLCNKMSH